MFKSQAHITLNPNPRGGQGMEQGNAGRGAPVDMQGGGGGSNNGGGGGVGGGPPFFPMAGGAGPGGGMMLGDAGLADEFMKLQQDFFKWQQQLLQNQHVLHSRVAPLATNPPQLQSVGVIRDILGQAPQGPPNGPPPPHQQVAEAHNPAVSVGAAVGGRRAPVERIINIRFEDGPSETDEAELHGPAFSRIGPVHDLSRDMAQMTTGMPAPRPAAPPPIQQQQQQPAPQRRWEEPNVSVGAWQDRPSTQAPLQQQQEAPTYPPMPSPTPLTPSQPLAQPFAQQRMSPRPQGPRGYSKPTEGALQWPPSTSSSTPSAQQEFQALPPEQKQQFAQFMQQQRQQPTWPPQQQQQQPYQPQPLQEQHKQVFVQQQQPTWTSPQPQQAPQQPPQQATWPTKQPSPQPQQPSQQPSQPPQQATWPPKQVSPQPVTARQLQQPAQQAEWPPKQPSPQPGTARQPQQPDSTVFWKELEDRRQGLGLGQEGQEQEGGAEPARPPRRGSRQDSPPQDATRPQYYFNGESTPSATPAGANAGPRYTSVVTVAADQPQEAGRDKVRSVVQLNAEQQPQQSQQAQRPAPVVRGFRQPTEEGVQSRIIANQAASRSRSSVSPPSATNGSEAQTVARIVPSATSTASTTPPQRTTPPRSSPTQSFPAVQLRPVQNRVSPPTEVPQPPPAAAGPPPPPPPAPPMAPPPPPAPTMPQGERRTATGKKIVTCKGGPELDAREELMMAIRSHGGMKSLRRTHPPV